MFKKLTHRFKVGAHGLANCKFGKSTQLLTITNNGTSQLRLKNDLRSYNDGSAYTSLNLTVVHIKHIHCHFGRLNDAAQIDQACRSDLNPDVCRPIKTVKHYSLRRHRALYTKGHQNETPTSRRRVRNNQWSLQCRTCSCRRATCPSRTRWSRPLSPTRRSPTRTATSPTTCSTGSCSAATTLATLGPGAARRQLFAARLAVCINTSAMRNHEGIIHDCQGRTMYIRVSTSSRAS